MMDLEVQLVVMLRVLLVVMEQPIVAAAMQYDMVVMEQPMPIVVAVIAVPFQFIYTTEGLVLMASKGTIESIRIA